MTYGELARLAEASGFAAWAPLNASAIELRPEVRAWCAEDACGHYGRCWSCPPACGSLEDCAAAIRAYAEGILVQTVGDMADWRAAEDEHRARFDRMREALRRAGAQALALNAGPCGRCEACTCPDAPCRDPDRMVSSMEAYGMLVREVCEANGLSCDYGPGRVAFTGCFLLGPCT